ncbi:hypothetical protein KR009_012261, partial [Drosophila setifemur]
LKFNALAKGDFSQDSMTDFVASHSDGDFIALMGSKTDLITLELTSKVTAAHLLPYRVVSIECSALNARPLDFLANQVDLEAIYSGSHVLEAQQLALETVYTAICSTAVPPAKLKWVQRAPGLLLDTNLLLAVLNTHGSLTLFSKPWECDHWDRFQSLNVPVTLRDKLLPKTNAFQINNFKKFQAYMDRAWITMFAWMSDDSGRHVLVLGTADGTLWILTLSPDAQTLEDHYHLKTNLDRICCMEIVEDLLLVGDVKGIIRLYRYSSGSGLTLVKTLWEKADRMGIQMALITTSLEKDCYYITTCKGAHLLTWYIPKSEDKDWIDAHFYVGGIKITALCSLGGNNLAVGTASCELKRIRILHRDNQLTFEMQSIEMDDLQDYRVMGLCSSKNNNFLTVLLYRNKEYMNAQKHQKNQLILQVGEFQEQDALALLTEKLTLNEPINFYSDYLAELRIKIFSQLDSQRFLNFKPLDSFQFTDTVTETQLRALQIKNHVLQGVIHLQLNHLQLLSKAKKSQEEMHLLLAMLATTHIRLRFKFLGQLVKLSQFQEQATVCMLSEAQRIMEELRIHFTEEHPLKVIANTFLEQMGQHFGVLLKKFGKPVQREEPLLRCSVSYVEIPPSLERRYCSLCDRQVLMELENLQELYEPGRTLLCPFCHGRYTLELLSA